MKTGMLFSPVFISTDPRLFTPACPVYPESRTELRREPRRTRLQTASPTRLASPRLLRPSSNSRLEPSKLHACNQFRFNTCGPSRKCGKQRTYREPKSFRCNTYKKHRGWGVLWLTRHPARGVSPVYPACPELRREPRRERPSGEKDLSLALQPLNLPACKRPLIHSIHRDPAHQLGIKVRRFLRHHFAGGRDFHHLLDVAGIQQKRNLRAPAVHGIQSRACFPLIRQVRFRRHRLRRNAQRGLPDKRRSLASGASPRVSRETFSALPLSSPRWKTETPPPQTTAPDSAARRSRKNRECAPPRGVPAISSALRSAY